MEIEFEKYNLIKSKFIRNYPLDNQEYIERIDKELKLIIKKNFVDYILKICEILDLIKDIPHIIRGSSGSSLVCFLIGITDIDPIKEKICFARFLNEYRNSMPDIDMDFPHNKRDKVFDRIFDKWSNVVRISNHVTYGSKSAIRKALKDMGVKGRVPKTRCNFNYFTDEEKKKELKKRVDEMKGSIKNYSLHCGGIIFYTKEEEKLVQDNMLKENQIKFDKRDVENNGFFKIDILSNRGLSQLFGIDKTPMLNYDFTDKKTIELLQSGNNIGLTFAESPAMRKAFTMFKPKNVYDIAICLAAIRPGASKEDCETIEDFNDNIVFDDDAIYYIKNLLGCDEDKADSVRRLYAKGDNRKISDFEMELLNKNPNLDVIDISNKLINLKKYSFCKSHALSYAYLVWCLAYQKAHNPKKFWKSTINNCSSMYRSWVHIREGISAGVTIKGEPELDNITHFYKYGYWIKPDFIDPNMYVWIANEQKMFCEFRGLIACTRWYKKWDKVKKKYIFLTFVTISFKNNVYLDLHITGWINVFSKNICSGKGYIISKNGYDHVKVTEIDYK